MDTDEQNRGLLRRIEELAARAAEEDQQPPEGPVLAAALTGLRAELGGLRAEIGTLRGDITAVRSGVEGSTGRLAGAMTAARAETEELSRRQDELREKVQDLADVVGEVRTTLPELRSFLVDQPDAAGAVATALSRLDEALETRLETLSGDLRRTLSASLTQVSAGTRAAETAWTDARSAVEERLAAVEDGIDGLAERLEALTRDSIGSATERIVAVEHKLDQIVGSTLAEAVDAQEQWARDVRTALTDLAAAVDRSLGSLGDSLNDAVRASRADERSHVDDAFTGLSETLERAVTGLEQGVAVARESTTSATADLRGFLEGFKATTDERLEQVRSQLADGLSEARTALVGEIAPTIQALESANTATTRMVEDEMSSLRTDLADALEEVRDRISSSVTKSQETVAVSIDEQRSSFADVVRTLRADVLDRVEESAATVSSGLDGLRGGVATAARSGEETVARLTEFAATLTSVETVVAQMNADWNRRTDAAIEVVVSAGHAAVEEFRTEVREVIGDLRGSVDTSRTSVDAAGDLLAGSTARLVTAGEALLGYLARRDQLLEQERDRVLHELLDAFAEGLSAKERRNLSERVGGALDRRRDARDAQRYRRQAGGEPPLAVPDVPDDLSALATPPTAATKSARPKQVAAGPAPAKKAAATKAAARKATATELPTKKAPAKKQASKAPAKKAPAKEAPAKEAPATKAAATDAPAKTTKRVETGRSRRAAKKAVEPVPPPAPEPATLPGGEESANTTDPLDEKGTTRV